MPAFDVLHFRSWVLCRNWDPKRFLDLQRMKDMEWAELKMTVHIRDHRGERRVVLNINVDKAGPDKAGPHGEYADHIGFGVEVEGVDSARQACRGHSNVPQCSHIGLEKPNAIPYVRGKLDERPAMQIWGSGPSHDPQYGQIYRFEWEYLKGVAVAKKWACKKVNLSGRSNVICTSNCDCENKTS